VCNASPDIRQQIESFPELHPRAPRHSPIAAIVLTNGDLDHVLGLFSLRESYPLVVYATEAVWRGLVDHNALMRTLRRFQGHVTWRPLVPGVETAISGVGDEPTGLFIMPRAVKGKIAVHLEGVVESSPDQNVGLWMRAARGRRAAYVSAVASVDDVAPHTAGLDLLLLDGTFWSSDELSRPGLSKNRAEDMAHLPIGDPGGTLSRAAHLAARRRIYTHINNTNPILVEGSAEREAVIKAGWRIAADGMDLTVPEDP
jgi:pyrroloquinoline quinone biosynthesis protein B